MYVKVMVASLIGLLTVGLTWAKGSPGLIARRGVNTEQAALLQPFQGCCGETLSYDDGSLEDAFGIYTTGNPDTIICDTTFAFANYFEHDACTLRCVTIWFDYRTTRNFHLWVWDDLDGHPNSGGTPLYENCNVEGPEPGFEGWWTIQIFPQDTIAAPENFWIGVGYSYLENSPEWYVGVDTNTVDSHCDINLWGNPGNWINLCDGYGYCYPFGIRAICTGKPTVKSSDAEGASEDHFVPNDPVFATGSCFTPNTTYPLYVVENTTWTDGMEFPSKVPNTADSITIDSTGNIWYSNLNPGGWPALVMPNYVVNWDPVNSVDKGYDMVIDYNSNGIFDVARDPIDGYTSLPGFNPVTLVDFTATQKANSVILRWATGTEIDNAGFNLHRGLSEESPDAKVNDQLIPAVGSAIEGASYSFTDEDVTEGITYYYWLEDVDLHGRSAMHGPVSATPGPSLVEGEEKTPIPTSFGLAQNYPNPFNPITEIKYDLPKDCQVKLTIFNLLGQKVATLVDEHQKAGYRSVHWDSRSQFGSELASGIYFYRLQAGDFVETRKMVLMK